MKPTYLAPSLILLLLLSLPTATAIPAEETAQIGDAQFWTYYSKQPTTDGRSNAINLLFDNSTDTITALLKENGWKPSQGAERYAYLTRDNSSNWTLPTAQLEKGSYHGVRHHIRLYSPENSGWSIGQAHYEYWDWLTLKHQVTSNQQAREQVENDLTHRADIRYRYIGNQGPVDSRGWIAVITIMTLLALPFRKLSSLLQNSGRTILGIFATVFSIRYLGILLDTILPASTITNSLYLLLLTGLAGLLATARVQGCRGFMIGFLSVLTALMLDIYLLGFVPATPVLHNILILATVSGTVTATPRTLFHRTTATSVWIATALLLL